MKYTWIPFYIEFGQKLIKYRNDRKPLINWIYENIDGTLIKHFKDAPDGRRVSDTDPFTVMAIINRGITYNKKFELCKQFKSFLSISAPVPQEFSGVPEMNNMQSNFMAFEGDREDGDIERLWNLFECAVLDKDIEEAYNALKNQYLIKYNITMGLFWIRPDKYLALDGNNKAKLTSLGIASFDGRFVPYKEYKAIMERLDKKMALGEINCTNYADFSYMTYSQEEGKGGLPKQEGLNNISSEKAYWMYSPGENASKWQECQEKGIMCIGWDELGDLSEYTSREDMRIEIKNSYPSDGSAKNDSLAVWQFSKEMKEGDIVFAKKGLLKIIGKGVVESGYIFDGSRNEFMHVRKVRWTHVGEWETTEKNAMKTLTNITKYKEYVNKLNLLIDDAKGMASEGEANYKASDEVDYWWLYANPNTWKIDTFNVGDIQEYTAYNEWGNKRQKFKYFKIVKPGDQLICYETSPTKKVKALCEVTRELHEDDGFEVFNFIIKEKVAYEIPWNELIQNEVFKGSEPYRAATGSLYHLTKAEYDTIVDLVRKKDDYTKADFLNKVFITGDDYDKLESLLLRKKNLILQGAPGVGKTFAAKRLAYAIMGEKDEDRVKIVQFHQNYSYEDFVMGYKPNENGGFDLKEGIFYQFCRKAGADKERNYFFIIDEINRGNLSKIFGELLMTIENDYRDTPIEMSYADRRFAVPSNVYLIGMMNTADRSLAMIDYALRRRFSFYEMKPAFENSSFKEYVEEKHDPRLNNLVKALKELNKVIADDDSLGNGFCIGHSYLCNLEEKYDLASIVEYDIVPMLREYWFDNDERFNNEARKLRDAIK